jgi:tetratricopeptide (TPR) repeat protein
MNITNDTYDWMIRTQSNEVLGPFRRSDVLAKLKAGELKGKTELCCANSYWFFVDERTEVERFFPESTGLSMRMMRQEPTATATATLAHVEQPANAPGKPEKIEWLSDEFADDFGNDISLESEENTDTKIRPIATPSPTSQGAPGRAAAPAATSHIETTPKPFVNPSLKKAAPKEQKTDVKPEIKEDSLLSKFSQKQRVLGFSIVLLAIIGLIFLADTEEKSEKNPKLATKASGASSQPAVPTVNVTLSQAFLLGDLDLIQNKLQEEDKGDSHDPRLTLAKALLKSKYQYDNESALASLTSFRFGNDTEQATFAEAWANTQGILNIDTDPKAALVNFKQALAGAPKDEVYLLNSGFAQLFAGNASDAAAIFQPLSTNVRIEYVKAMANIGLALALEQTKQNTGAIENLLRQAQSTEQVSSEAALLLAYFKIKKGASMQELAPPLRSFLDSLPELEQGRFLVHYRAVNINNRIYNHVKSAIRDAIQPRPAALLSAVESMALARRGQFDEASQILEQAFVQSPGHLDLLKAKGYLLFKEAKYQELIDLLRDKVGSKADSAPFLVLLAKANLQIKNYQQADTYVQILTEKFAERSDSWALAGDLSYAKKDTNAAQARYANALARNPFSARALLGMARLGRADLFNSSAYRDLFPFWDK